MHTYTVLYVLSGKHPEDTEADLHHLEVTTTDSKTALSQANDLITVTGFPKVKNYMHCQALVFQGQLQLSVGLEG